MPAMEQAAILGIDIGGANLKAAHTNGAALTVPFALWRYPNELTGRLRAIRAQMPAHDRIALTMTGELCDCFESKRNGVLAILGSAEEAADGTSLRIWTMRGALVEPKQIRKDPLSAAAANWLALAYFACRYTESESALLIDTGSTTTDIVYLDNGKPHPLGLTDRERMASGELVYAAVRRTPVCAVLGLGVAAEVFATMLDAYLLVGLVPESPDDTDTADGRPATRQEAAARLARMLCADVAEVPPAELEAFATKAIEIQASYMSHAIDRVIEGRARPRRIVLSGSGDALGRLVLARHPELLGTPAVYLAERLGPALSEAACAYSVAILAAR